MWSRQAAAFRRTTNNRSTFVFVRREGFTRKNWSFRSSPRPLPLELIRSVRSCAAPSRPLTLASHTSPRLTTRQAESVAKSATVFR
jgi:hypothetical protein